jgi:iron complex outermembrane receptor protein
MCFSALRKCFWLAGMLLPASLVMADEAASEAEPEATALEEVIVVGSRITRSNLDSPSPVLVFEAAELLDNGITTVGEFTRYLPQNSALPPQGFLSSTVTAGTAGFNLRGIGMDATLTLLNGRRVVPSGASSDLEPFVDINAIPVAAIDRIEILTDGASAIYGSEAVAGVVNIVTYQTIDGVVAEGGFLTTSEGDGDEWDMSLAGGWNDADTSFTATLSWFDRDTIFNRDRDWSSTVDLREQGGYDYGNSASSPPTAFLLDSGVFLADPACPEYSDTAHLVVYVPGEVEVCSFNTWNFTTLQSPSRRLGTLLSASQQLASSTRLFAELFANRTESKAVVAPTVLLDFFVPVDHPDNPFGEDLFLEGRALDTGNREFKWESTSWRLVTGLEGDWGSWAWEAAAMAAESETDQTRFNFILTDPFQEALLGLGGPNGDQYYNPFGLNPQNPQEVIDEFAISDTHFVQTAREQTLDFQLTGKFGDLPGGPVGTAFGGQYRHQTVDQEGDEEELTGVITGSDGFDPISESDKIYSVFAEFLLPVLATVEAQLAVRLDDYSDFGSTTNPKIGLGWRPTDGLLLRATWGTSFRPPTFRELTDPTIVYDDVVFLDPWRCPATDLAVDCLFNPITTEFSGNPDLEPDEGETWLVGLAWEPPAAEGFKAAIDYWRIDHSNRIMTSEGRFLFEALPPDENPFVIRAPQTDEDLALGIPGVIVGRRNTYINADTVTTAGIDLNLDYSWQMNGADELYAGISYSYLDEYSTGIAHGQAIASEDFAGRTGDSPWPQHRGNLNLGWSRGGHGITGLINYAGDYDSPVNLVVDEQETDTVFVIDDYWQFDLQYSYVFESLKSAIFRVGCRNCFAADPPVYNYPVPGEYLHEGRGAQLYVRWTQPFQ